VNTKSKTSRRNKPQHPLLITGGVVLLAVVALFAIFVASNGSKNTNSDAGQYRFAVGDPGPGQLAPPIVLPSTAGGNFDLASLKGKTVLLYFQEGIGCQSCWDQMRDIEANRQDFSAVGIDEFVTITSDSLDLSMRKIAQDGITGPVLADIDLAVSKTYDANSYGMMGNSTNGHSFIVVGADGRIRWRADYGGAPDYTMYVPVPSLLADLNTGLAASKTNP
jgi:peroxiredoxin Q/BCP